mmetsp:Transcript_82111/g.171909  ORF Transcript_82111/g.171909 Transcript_82111/m.171909 type:complete len:320 (-) Transcript_82111:271-1230(-)
MGGGAAWRSCSGSSPRSSSRGAESREGRGVGRIDRAVHEVGDLAVELLGNRNGSRCNAPIASVAPIARRPHDTSSAHRPLTHSRRRGRGSLAMSRTSRVLRLAREVLVGGDALHGNEAVESDQRCIETPEGHVQDEDGDQDLASRFSCVAQPEEGCERREDHDGQHYQQCPDRHEKHAVIALPYTIVQPGAVVVEIADALVALPTMFAVKLHSDLANRAEGKSFPGLSERFGAPDVWIFGIALHGENGSYRQDNPRQAERHRHEDPGRRVQQNGHDESSCYRSGDEPDCYRQDLSPLERQLEAMSSSLGWLNLVVLLLV